MITYEDKVFNTWEEIVALYPMMWVVFDKATVKHGRVVEGHIMAILPDEEVIAYELIHDDEIELSLRTTETIRIFDEAGNYVGVAGNTGYIHGELINA